jgi:signal peptidase
MRALRWAAGLWLAVVTGLVLVAVVPQAFGLTATVVTTGSMRDVIKPGDVLVYADPDPATIAVGDIVVFRNPAHPGVPISHRVVDRSPDGILRTKGDANRSPDPFRTPLEDVIGLTRMVVPMAGRPALIWHRGAPEDYAWWAVLVICAVLVTSGGSRSRHP